MGAEACKTCRAEDESLPLTTTKQCKPGASQLQEADRECSHPEVVDLGALRQTEQAEQVSPAPAVSEAPAVSDEKAKFLQQLDEQSKGDVSLVDAPSHLRDDREVVLAAVRLQGLDLQFASERLQDDPRVVKVAMLENPKAIDFASRRLRANPEVLRAMPKRRPSTISQLDSRAGRRPCLCAISNKDLKAEWITAIMAGESLQDAPFACQNDRAVVLAACKVDAAEFKFASERLRDDEAFVAQCVLDGIELLPYATERLRYCPELISAQEKRYWLEALKVGGPGKWLDDAPEPLRDDEEVVWIAALRSVHLNLPHASLRIRGNRPFVLRLLRAGLAPLDVFLATEALNEDEEVLRCALRHCKQQDREAIISCLPQPPAWIPEFNMERARSSGS